MDCGKTLQKSGPGDEAGPGCPTATNPQALFHPQPWVWAKRLLLFYWAQSQEGQNRWPSIRELASELRCTAAGLSKDLLIVRNLTGLQWAGGKSERSKRAFKIAQRKALARGTHTSFKRRDKKGAMENAETGPGDGQGIDSVQ